MTVTSLLAIKTRLTIPASVTTSSAVGQAVGVCASTPEIPGIIAQTFLEGTPGARPVSYILREADARVRLLMARSSELLARADAIHGERKEEGGGDGEEGVEEQSGCGKEQEGEGLREKLAEAMAVIHEQDRLIHDALLR